MSITLTCLILIAVTYQDGISNRSRSDWSSLKVFVCMVSVFLADKNFCIAFPEHGFKQMWLTQNLSSSDNKRYPKKIAVVGKIKLYVLLAFGLCLKAICWDCALIYFTVQCHGQSFLVSIVLAWCISRQCVVDSLKEDVPPNPTVDSVDHDQAADPLYGVTPMWLEGGHQRGTFVSNFRGWLDPTPE